VPAISFSPSSARFDPGLIFLDDTGRTAADFIVSRPYFPHVFLTNRLQVISWQ
jgi:hypothetical protein